MEWVGFLVKEIDYINLYGIGLLIGDKIECWVFFESGLLYVWINVIKLIIGYGLSVVGMVEIIVVFL